MRYDELSFQHDGQEFHYDQLLRDLGSAPYSHCHLDPDIREDIVPRNDYWSAGFGQCGSSAAELRNKGIAAGDLFLFFGWFREAELTDGHFRYVPKSPSFHVIWGFMEVGAMVDVKVQPVPELLTYHPHTKDETLKAKSPNLIFSATDSPTCFDSGYGTFEFCNPAVLTHDHESGGRRSDWAEMDFLTPIGNRVTHRNGLWSVPGQWQELVCDVREEGGLRQWLAGFKVARP